MFLSKIRCFYNKRTPFGDHFRVVSFCPLVDIFNENFVIFVTFTRIIIIIIALFLLSTTFRRV